MSKSRVPAPLDSALDGSWMTSLRRAWFGNYLWDLKKDDIIQAWSWASNETKFCEPMTKPALSQDQQSCMDAEYLAYLELLGYPTTIRDYVEFKYETSQVQSGIKHSPTPIFSEMA